MLAAEGDHPARWIQLVIIGGLADRPGQGRPQRGAHRIGQRPRAATGPPWPPRPSDR